MDREDWVLLGTGIMEERKKSGKIESGPVIAVPAGEKDEAFVKLAKKHED